MSTIESTQENGILFGFYFQTPKNARKRYLSESAMIDALWQLGENLKLIDTIRPDRNTKHNPEKAD